MPINEIREGQPQINPENSENTAELLKHLQEQGESRPMGNVVKFEHPQEKGKLANNAQSVLGEKKVDLEQPKAKVAPNIEEAWAKDPEGELKKIIGSPNLLTAFEQAQMLNVAFDNQTEQEDQEKAA